MSNRRQLDPARDESSKSHEGPAGSESSRDGDLAVDLSTAAAKGFAWQGITTIGIRILRAAVFLMLARLLSPDAFGLAALAMVFVVFLQLVGGGGLSSAIVRQTHLRRDHLDTGFVLSAIAGIAFGSLLIATAHPLSQLYRQPDLLAPLLALGAMPLILSLTMVPEGILARAMNFKSLSLRHIASTTVSVGAAAALAIGGAGIWALIAQTLVEAVVSLVALWAAVWRVYRPRLKLTKRAVADLVPYGLKTVGLNLTNALSQRSDDFLIGAVLGPVALGTYSVAYRLLTILLESLIGVAGSVAFPLFARTQDDPGRLRSLYGRVCVLLFALAAPVFLFVAVSSPVLVQVALGPKWLAAAPVVSALALAGLVIPLAELNSLLLQATGSAGRALSVQLANAVCNVLGFAVAVRFGIFWVAVAFTVRAYLVLPLSFVAIKHLDVDVKVIAFRVGRLSLCMTMPFAGGIICLRLESIVSSAGAMAIAIPATAVLYLVSVRFVDKRTFNDTLAVVRKIVNAR